MCDCKTCQHIAEFQKILQGLPKYKKAWLEDLYECYMQESTDRSYYKCILDGTWPQSKEILESALSGLKEKELGKES